MPRKIAELIEEARGHLNDRDDAPYRYSDEDLLRYYNDAYFDTRRLRPDLFTGTYATELEGVAAGTDLTTVDFPLTGQYWSAFVVYVVGMAEIRDDEFAVDGRASQLLLAFRNKLMTAAA